MHRFSEREPGRRSDDAAAIIRRWWEMSRTKGNLPQPTGQPDLQSVEAHVVEVRPFLSDAFDSGFAPVWVGHFCPTPLTLPGPDPAPGRARLAVVPIMPPYHPSATKERPLGGERTHGQRKAKEEGVPLIQ